MLTTLKERERTSEKALSANGNGTAQSLGSAATLYCNRHGVVNGFHGHCETCVDEGYRDWDATRIAKELIPSWTGIDPDGRQVIVAPVRDALDAVQAINQYKHSDAIVLIVWDTLVTALDRDRIGPNWVLPQTDADEIECARCAQPFRPTWGDEKLCDQCWLAENGPPHR